MIGFALELDRTDKTAAGAVGFQSTVENKVNRMTFDPAFFADMIDFESGRYNTMSRRRSARKANSALIPIVECPPELSAAARKEWDRIAPALAEEGRLTTLDRPTLAIYCTAFTDWIAAIEALQSFGPVMKSPSGYPVQSPYVSIAAKHADTVIRLAAEFGLTPASRRRNPVSNNASWMDEIQEIDDFGLKPLTIDPPGTS